MATATVLPDLAPDLAVGMAESMADVFQTRKLEEMTPEEASAAIRACEFLRDLFATARHSIEDSLSRGVDAKAFSAKYKSAVTDLEAILQTVQRVVAKARTGGLPKPTEEFVSQYQAFGADIADLRLFLLEAITKAEAPSRGVDWNKVREVEAAYKRGETKSFRRSSE